MCDTMTSTVNEGHDVVVGIIWIYRWKVLELIFRLMVVAAFGSIGPISRWLVG